MKGPLKITAVLVFIITAFTRMHASATPTHAVVAPEPLAAHVGTSILNQGGNAADAAVAIAFALAVTYPQAGNIGGGGFAMVYRPGNDPIALDFRETAPERAERDMFVDPTGKPVPEASTRSTLSTGVPGTVRGLVTLWESYGSLPFDRLVQPAIELAEKGHRISVYQASRLAHYEGKLGRDVDCQKLFLPDGQPLKTGDVLVQKSLSKTLTRIARRKDAGFYAGPVARDFVRELQEKGGRITQADLSSYRAIWRTPVHIRFRGDDLFLMPLPSSGGILIGQILGMMEQADRDMAPVNSVAYIHRIAELERRAFADRSAYLGDPDMVPIRWHRLLKPAYLKQRIKGFDPEHATPSKKISPGYGPPETSGLLLKESPETTSFAVLDQNGNAVSVTYTLNGAFGCAILLPDTGILLNNEMDDFAIAPGIPNQFGLVGGNVNAVGPAKRMLSSMTPTIVLRDGQFKMALGSPGGSRIITTVLQTYLNVSVQGLSAGEAVSLPRFHHQWLPDVLYLEPLLFEEEARINALTARGYRLESKEKMGDAVIIQRLPDGHIDAAADPRGSGVAILH